MVSHISPKPPKSNLRLRIALYVALPLITILLVVSMVQYIRTLELFNQQVATTMHLVGDTVLGSLNHAMLTNDRSMVTIIIDNVVETETVQQAMIVDLQRQVKVTSNEAELNLTKSESDLGCIECHSLPSNERPAVTRLSGPREGLRISVPIANETDCYLCHGPEASHLGVLLVDVSIADLEQEALISLLTNFIISIFVGLVGAVITYMLLNWMVVRRIEAIRKPLTQFAEGNLARRIPINSPFEDEIYALTISINQMAERIEQQIREQEQLGELRYQTIVSERKRIARELHDGLGQLLGYVNTKVTAARLYLRKNKIGAVEAQLADLEDAVQQLHVDIRVAIAGLKMAGENDDLVHALQDYTHQLEQLIDLPVDVTINPQVDSVNLTAVSRVQLLRIVQESLNNVRKHASATRAFVNIDVIDDNVQVIISDNGVGFKPEILHDLKDGRYGLASMRERAELIDAQIEWQTSLGKGTQVTINIPIEDGR